MVIRRLLKRFGWVRAPATHKYEVDDAFHPVLISLAEQQQSSPDEMVSDLLHEALNNAFWRNTGLESITERYNQLRYSR